MRIWKGANYISPLSLCDVFEATFSMLSKHAHTVRQDILSLINN